MNSLYDQIGEEKIDKLIDVLYDDIISKDDRIDLLFYDGYENVKREQKKFFRMFLGIESNVFNMPNLKEKHYKIPITKETANYWQEDFEKAIDKIDINGTQRLFLKQKIKMLTLHMINMIKK